MLLIASTGPLVCRRFEFCPEVTAKLRRRGIPIHEVPIRYTARTFDAGKKIQAIKEVRALTNLGLKEAKDLVDNAPKPVLEHVPKEQADQAKEKLEAAGAGVEIK